MPTTYDDAIGYDEAAVLYNDLAAPDQQYLIKRTAMDGTEVCTLVDAADIQPIRDVLNSFGSTGFTLHNFDPLAPQVEDLSEVQVWRDGSHLWTGVVVTSDSTWEPGRDQTSFEVRGLPWYLWRRLYGNADRTNYAANPEFESGTSSWTATGTTFTVNSTKRKTGTSSAHLQSAVVAADRYISQVVAIPANGVGNLVTLVGWFWIEPGTWTGGAYEERGLFLQRIDSLGVPQEFDFDAIDDDTPRGAWQRAKTTVWLPPNVSETVQMRLYSPAATIRWDAVSLTLMESVSHYDTDQSAIAAASVVHAQDPVYGKSSLLIGTSTPATGVKRDRHYQHAEHGSIGGALTEFPSLDDGFDWSVETTGTTRTFTTHFPHKGTARSAFAESEFTKVRLVFDGESAASSVVVGGDADGPDREEGEAVDTLAFDGLILEDWSKSPTGAEIDSLDARAAEKLRVLKNPQVLEATLAPGLRIGSWVPGDTATIVIDHGRLQVAGSWRCIETAIDPHTDQLSFKANPA